MAPAVDFTDQETWKRLRQAGDVEALAEPWLRLQCAQMKRAVRAMLVIEGDGGAPTRVVWPEGREDPLFEGIVERARGRRRGVLEEPPGGEASIIAFPLILDDAAVGGVAVRLAETSTEALLVEMRRLQWGMAWLREGLLAARGARLAEDRGGGRVLLEVAAAALEPAGFEASARALVTDLAHRFACDRVSIGFLARARSRIVAISHSAHFGRDMNLVRLLEEAMDEAIDQHAVIVHPAPAGSLHATRSHEELARAESAGTVLTIPMFLRDRWIGAITLERPVGTHFSPEDCARLDAAAAVLAPILDEKRANDRNVFVKLAEAAAGQWRRLVGPGHAVAKAVVAGTVFLVLLFAVWTDTYRVTAEATVEGRVQRALVAGYAGFLREAPARAGDVVREGDVLAALDDRDLVLERLKWTTEKQRRGIEYEKALGDRLRSDMRVSANLVEQAEAQIRLADEQLSRAKVVAPFDGLIVAGDHSQSIGASVQRGQTLFEIAPITGHRVMLAVDESQIAELREGQTGRLVVAALPGEGFPVEIVRLTPIAKAEEGRNTFRVEARPVGETPALRPGMRGVAKIEIDRRRVAWIWTRSLGDWLRLALWRWVP